MNQRLFLEQISRLSRQWKHSYGEERVNLLWEKLKGLDDEFIMDAVNEFIANRRSAPVLNDFLDFQEDFKKRKRFNESRDGQFSLLKTMDGWAGASPNAKFAKKCVALLAEKNAGRISAKQFFDFCDALDLEAKGTSQCVECTSSGLIMASKKGYRYAFRCACNLGKMHQALPAFDSMIYGGFEIV